MADTKITPRLKALYNDKIAKELQKNLVFQYQPSSEA